MPRYSKEIAFCSAILLGGLIIVPTVLAADDSPKNTDVITAIASIITIVGTVLGGVFFLLNKIEAVKKEILSSMEKELLEKEVEIKASLSKIKAAYNELLIRYNNRGDKIKDRFTIYGIRIKANHNAALNINERLVNTEKQIEDVYNKLGMKQRQQNQSSVFKNILSGFDSIPDLSDIEGENSGKIE